MIRTHHIDGPIRDSFPQRLHIIFMSQRRVDLSGRKGGILARQYRIVRAGFGKDLTRASILGLFNDFEGFAARNVDHIQGRAGLFRQIKGSLCGLRFHIVGP